MLDKLVEPKKNDTIHDPTAGSGTLLIKVIPVAILIFRKNRKGEDILFIDASNDYIDKPGQNKLSEIQVDRIYRTYKNYKSIDKYSYVAIKDEIIKYDYNLNIPIYLDTYEKDGIVDRNKISTQIIKDEENLKIVREKIKKT